MDGAYVALSGYKFQFDRTMFEIFSNPAKTIEIEQLQDYGYDDYLVQVKYHNTHYTPSQQKQKLKTPIVKVLVVYRLRTPTPEVPKSDIDLCPFFHYALLQ